MANYPDPILRGGADTVFTVPCRVSLATAPCAVGRLCEHGLGEAMWPGQEPGFGPRPHTHLPQTMHAPLLPADGQVQVEKGQHSQALRFGAVLGDASHLLELLHLFCSGHCGVTLLCHKQAQVAGLRGPQVRLQTTEHRNPSWREISI